MTACRIPDVFLKPAVHSRPFRPLAALALTLFLTGCDDGSSSGGILDGMRQGPGVLEGTISIEPGTRIDRDTALGIVEQDPDTDRQNPQNQNASFFGDITLGGYVSATQGDYNGNFSYPVDVTDSFLLELDAGDRVGVDAFLVRNSADVSIRLFEADGDEVAPDEDESSSFTAEQDGEHRLVIEAVSGGPVRYLARQRTSLSSAAQADFVPGEALITMESQASGDQIRAQSRAPISTRTRRSLGQGRMHVTMPDATGVGSLSVPNREATLEWIETLRETPGIASATPNYRVESAMVSGAEGPDERDWHHQLIEVDQAWEQSAGEGFRIAILDTGAHREDDDWHPGLAPNINCSGGGQGCFDAVDEGTLPIDEDDDFHGTHVAGIASAAAASEVDVDEEDHLQGVAYSSSLIPVRVLAGSQGTLADVIAGVEWVVNPGGTPRADIINLSLGGPGSSPALESVLAEAEEAGIPVIAAAGNNANQEPFFPAAYPDVLSVGSVSCTRERSGFSSFGDWLALAAPGGGNANSCRSGIYSTSGNEGLYGELAGTSMASPQVAAVLALIMDAHGNGGLSPRVVRALVREGRLTAPDDGRFDIERGRGVLDAAQAIETDPAEFAALEPGSEQIRLNRAEPRVELEFESVGVAASFQQLALSLTEDVDWLAEPTRESDRTFAIALDEPVSGRSYRTNIEVSYQVNGEARSYELPVSASIDDLDRVAAGVHFVQLIAADEFEGDGDTLSPVMEKAVRVDNGEYRFEMDVSELEPGRYYLVAGSDIDNDGVLGQPGEAYGVFTDSRGGPEAIEINRRMDKSVSFETGFLTPEDFGLARQTRRANQ